MFALRELIHSRMSTCMTAVRAAPACAVGRWTRWCHCLRRRARRTQRVSTSNTSLTRAHRRSIDRPDQPLLDRIKPIPCMDRWPFDRSTRLRGVVTHSRPPITHPNHRGQGSLRRHRDGASSVVKGFAGAPDRLKGSHFPLLDTPGLSFADDCQGGAWNHGAWRMGMGIYLTIGGRWAMR